MAQTGGAGNSNPDVVNSLELKATSNQLVLDSLGNKTTITDGAPGGDIVITLPSTTSTLATLADVQASDTLQEVFDNGQTITIADTDNQTLAITQNDTTNNPDAVTITNTSTGRPLFINNDGLSASIDVDADVNSASNLTAVTINAANAGAGDAIALDVTAGEVDFGAVSKFTITNAAAFAAAAVGEFGIDTTITDYTGMVKYHDGVEELTVLAVPTGNLSTVDGQVVSYNATNNELEFVTNSATSNTLDQAYDQGGAGAGRTITADSGAVQINGTALGGDDLLGVDHTASGTLTANTTNVLVGVASRTHTAATTVSDNFDLANLTRTNVSNNAGATLNAAGSVAHFENVATQTLGTLADTVNVVEIVQDADSTGDALNVSGGSFRHDHRTIFTPVADQSLTAGSAIVVDNGTIFKVSGSGGAVTLTSTPTIADGVDGQMIILLGVDDTNTLKLQSEGQLASSNLHLTGDNDFTLGLGDTLQLVFSSDDSAWVEIARSDN